MWKNLSISVFKFVAWPVYYPVRQYGRYVAYRKNVEARTPFNSEEVIRSKFKGVNSKFVTTKDGKKIEVWYNFHNHAAPTVLYFHGTYMNLAKSSPVFDAAVKSGYNIVAFDYRGYGNSKGVANEKGLYKDSNAVMAWLREQKISPDNIILVGHSMGTGPAVEMGLKNPDMGALVLVAPFSSMQDRMKPLARPFALDDMYDSKSKIINIKMPILIMHGTKDKMIDISHSEDLVKAGGNNIKFQKIEGAKHVMDADIILKTIKDGLPPHFDPENVELREKIAAEKASSPKQEFMQQKQAAKTNMQNALSYFNPSYLSRALQGVVPDGQSRRSRG